MILVMPEGGKISSMVQRISSPPLRSTLRAGSVSQKVTCEWERRGGGNYSQE